MYFHLHCKMKNTNMNSNPEQHRFIILWLNLFCVNTHCFGRAASSALRTPRRFGACVGSTVTSAAPAEGALRESRRFVIGGFFGRAAPAEFKSKFTVQHKNAEGISSLRVEAQRVSGCGY